MQYLISLTVDLTHQAAFYVSGKISNTQTIDMQNSNPVQRTKHGQLSICNFSSIPEYTYNTLLTSLSINLTENQKQANQTFIIDNTFYPCINGSYQPELYLQEQINITIQQNISYGFFVKISILFVILVFILILQVLIIAIAYIIVMFKKYSKLQKRLEYLKGQEQAQDLLNSFLGAPLVHNSSSKDINVGSDPRIMRED